MTQLRKPPCSRATTQVISELPSCYFSSCVPPAIWEPPCPLRCWARRLNRWASSSVLLSWLLCSRPSFVSFAVPGWRPATRRWSPPPGCRAPPVVGPAASWGELQPRIRFDCCSKRIRCLSSTGMVLFQAWPSHSPPRQRVCSRWSFCASPSDFSATSRVHCSSANIRFVDG